MHCISAEDSAEAVDFLPHRQMEQMCCAGAAAARSPAPGSSCVMLRLSSCSAGNCSRACGYDESASGAPEGETDCFEIGGANVALFENFDRDKPAPLRRLSACSGRSELPALLAIGRAHGTCGASISAQPRSKRQLGRMVLMIIISARFWRVSRPMRTPSGSVTARAVACGP